MTNVPWKDPARRAHRLPPIETKAEQPATHGAFTLISPHGVDQLNPSTVRVQGAATLPRFQGTDHLYYPRRLS